MALTDGNKVVVKLHSGVDQQQISIKDKNVILQIICSRDLKNFQLQISPVGQDHYQINGL